LLPLDECRQEKIINWTDEKIAAFDKLKQLFGDYVQLNHIQWGEQIYLTTDACQSGIGAWLGQRDKNGIIQPFICASKKLSKTQQRWSTTKRELYALMWSMKKFHYYLYGQPFIARVDHKPLVNIVTSGKLSLIMQGWIDNLLLYDFTTIYLPGEENVLADALSRQFEVVESEIEVCAIIGVDDDEISELDIKLQWEAEKRGFEVPTKLKREELIKNQHALGHFGIEASCQRIQEDGYWWPKMR